MTSSQKLLINETLKCSNVDENLCMINHTIIQHRCHVSLIYHSFKMFGMSLKAIETNTSVKTDNLYTNLSQITHFYALDMDMFVTRVYMVEYIGKQVFINEYILTVLDQLATWS